MIKIYILILSVVFDVVTVRPAIAAEKDSLTGKWLIRHIYNYGNVDETPPIYFHFGDKIISAYDGCNYISFYYQSEEKNKIKFDVANTASTQMGCIANGAILSEKWREMVNKVNKYEMTPEALYLLHHDKMLATLVKQDNRIIGIRWQVKGYNVNGGVQFRSDIPNIWIVLKSNGSIEGEGECLPFIGTYQIDELKNSVKLNVRSTSLERCSWLGISINTVRH
ncbi:META domain-containing protein [Arsenophonus nasoniae]|uniref:META domain-containing protein n=1 Tax=Arsenophonus nasoniae TaxID=638 RepID=A0AA95JZP8_9GAMM|nr:META domain-containing protein [Arsenophonus nasoniae]WGL93946.1 META domain-containing protein [Arsenophonus nasoniae]